MCKNSGILKVCIVHVTGYWKLTKMSHLAYFILLAQLIARLLHYPVHCCINRLSWLVCFSRTGFANHVKSQLRQWGPWRELDGRYGMVYVSDTHPCVSETSLRPSRLVWAYDLHFLYSYNLQTVQMEAVTCLWLPTHSHHSPHPLPPTQSFIHAIDLWYYSGCEKKLLKIQQCYVAT